MFSSAQSISERSGKNFERFILLEVTMRRNTKTACRKYETDARECAAARNCGLEQFDRIATVQYQHSSN
jgi:hypothetical protein